MPASRALRFASLAALKKAVGPHCGVRVEPGPLEGRARRLRAGEMPQERLWRGLIEHVPTAVYEYCGAVPGRRYRIDIAIPERRLAIEVDGWQYHGRHKGDFARDRERQNALTLHGWRILRFTAGQIRKDLQGCIRTILEAAAV